MLSKFTFKAQIGVLLSALLPAAASFSAPAQIPGSGGELSVIVTLSDKVDPADFSGKGTPKGLLRARLITALKAKAGATQGPLMRFLKSRGAGRAVSLWLINGLAVTAPAEVIREVASFPGIESVRPDVNVMAPSAVEGTVVIPEWNLDLVHAPEMWGIGQAGGGIVVANLDTGVDVYHPDLAPRWRGGSNSWYDPNGQHSSPYDSTGHGTQTMGLLVGGSAGGSAIGMAPDARWIAVKIFNDAGVASASAIHLGFQWVLDPDGNPQTDDAADVVNNSWGFDQWVNTCYPEFEQDIRTLKAAGIAVVFSAGNQGSSGSTSVSPANNPSGFAAGAVDDAGAVALFSSRGPSACDGSIYPEVVAPGVNIRTAALSYGGSAFDPYTTVTGTSFAAPHISGAITLLLGANPTATVAELEYALKNTSHDLGSAGGDNTYGYGLIDVLAAGSLLGQGPICIDNDGDGFFGHADCGTPLDCNDYDSGINPSACDIIGDGIDQNCDGADRTKGKACPVGGGGGGSGGSEGSGQTCSDGLDNDGNGLIDCADPKCSKNKACK
jgi:serine protease AprX